MCASSGATAVPRATPPHCGPGSARHSVSLACCNRRPPSRRRPNLPDDLELTELNESSEGAASRTVRELEAVYDIPVTVSAVLGKTTMQVSQLLKLGRGAVVELDRKLGEAIDIYVNNRLVARGEVVMVDDSRLGVTMTEIVKADRVP